MMRLSAFLGLTFLFPRKTAPPLWLFSARFLPL
jgi:hypothetical protein